MKYLVNCLRRLFTPTFTVVFAAACVVIFSLIVRSVQRDSLEAKVTYEAPPGRSSRRQTPSPPPKAYEMADANLRLAERINDASAAALGLSLFAVRERVQKQKTFADARELLREFGNSELFPPGFTLAEPTRPTSYGLLATPRGTYFIRYRPRPLALEILAGGSQGLESGAPFMLRVPEVIQPVVAPADPAAPVAGYWATLFVAPASLDAPIPAPFASPAAYLAVGWLAEPLRAVPFTEAQTQELNRWLATYPSS